MKNENKKGFTLIELISVLVILAILALIVTPLVLNIIKKARTAADKRSIDAYGRSIELAIADYLLDNGSFPTSVEQLTIEYSGDKVECAQATLKEDGSVYLSECTVAGREVAGYTYGKGEKEEPTPTYEAYSVGDEVTYNNVNYYVIKDSDETESSVTLLKAEPLTIEEVNQYGAGHVNKYTSSSQGTAEDVNGYGGMAYYSSETCGYVNGNKVDTGCTIDYKQSEVKYVVDAWQNENVSLATETRLISFEDLATNLGYDESGKQCAASCWYEKSDNVPNWLYNSNYWYWTMSPYQDLSSKIWVMNTNGELGSVYVSAGYYKQVSYFGVVRPVITLSKSSLSS